ncbi:RloB domain-containing protein [Patescibacteria group bacterium]|nr:RloB domain-containing protein [Patescibacteria group bacterium]
MSRFARKENTRKPKRVIRIYTEGKKTEPNYFNSIKDELKLTTIEIKVDGRGDHTLSLVEWVIDRKNAETDKDLETEWWVVFDRDDHDDFNKSIELALANGVQPAYSNECFELWFILHFEFLNTSIGRDKFEPKLSKLLGRKYDKSTSDIYELIKDKEASAIRNAKRLHEQHDKAGTTSHSKRDPSTHVHKLVERLRSFKSETKQ